ncbi:hypothetical protein [Chryseobacterium polytrichastri]|uniref:Uncharacterized protein n=1 Tax=Chryseobacterium polytrichastri TaxID=1302687 RepID=A0A1M6U2R6_9FLAO|nr:hypothetical protein [Chryseobacterium polytrichastri]SHK63453.1 hypothetical protein SAMN05444267_100626 [Chryseobacterium polytrichastri]
MKKILLTAFVLASMTALTKAQQGRVGINTTTPAATLDVVANTTDATRPDALLVPRMARTQLYAKDAAYTAAQNGALAFVTAIDGTATAKTANVTATGFYYYDGTNNVWTAVGGGGAATPQRYEVIRGTATAVNASYTAANTDFFLVTNAAGGITITLPAADATNSGRLVVISNQNTTASTVTVVAANAVPVAGTATVLQFRGKQFISDGTKWVSISYN